MKINEILIESQLQEGPLLNKLGSAVGKGVGTLAKGAGAVAGGIAGIGSAFKKGFSAGRGTVAAAGDDEPAAGAAPAQAQAATAKPSTASSAAPAAAPAAKAAAKPAAQTAAKPAAQTAAKPAAQPAASKTAPQPQDTAAAPRSAPAANDTQYAQAQKAIAALKPADQKKILKALQADPKVQAAMNKSTAAPATASPDATPTAEPAAQSAAGATQNAKYPGLPAGVDAERANAANQAAGLPPIYTKNPDGTWRETDQAKGTWKGDAGGATGITPAKKTRGGKKVAPDQATIDADRERIMGPTSDSIIRKGKSIIESIDEAGLMAKLGAKVGQAAQAAGHVAGSAARGVDIAKDDPEHAAAMVKAFKTGQTDQVQATATKIQDRSGTVPPAIIQKLNQLTLEQRAELHQLLVNKTA